MTFLSQVNIMQGTSPSPATNPLRACRGTNWPQGHILGQA